MRTESASAARAVAIISLFEGVMHDLDTTRLPIYPRIHQNGSITDTEGAKNIISLRSDKLAPSDKSEAITVIKLINSEILDLRSFDNHSHQLRACSRFGLAINLSAVRSMVGISTSAINEFRISKVHPKRLARCFTLELSATKSMILPSSHKSELPWIRSLIPVERIYTLYLDRNLNFRYLGHNGISNIENQPIATKIKTIHLTTQIDANNLVKVHLAVESLNRHSLPMTFSTMLAKRDPSFTLLTRP